MSEVSALSQEYQTAADLSHTLNRAVIDLKKARLAHMPGMAAGEQVSGQLSQLAEILDALAALVGPGGEELSDLDGTAAVKVPGTLVAQLRETYAGTLEYFLEDLRATANHLREGAANLTDGDVDRLDALANVTAGETASAFRRLMRH